MSLHVTQCPSCESSFNASARLLNAAQGLVRCGACLSVFDAVDNVIKPNAFEEGDFPADAETTSVFISQPEEFFDVLRFVRSAGRLTAASPHPAPLAKAAPEREQEEQEDAKNEAETVFPILADESVAAQAVPADEFFAAVSDSLPDPEPPHPIDKAEIRARLRATPLVDDYDDNLGVLSDDELATLTQVPDALELEPLRGPSRLLYRLGMGTLSLVLIVTLALQFFWQRLELLSLHPDLRPAYALACDWLGCVLSPLEDLDAIAIENLLVRSHPEQPDSLIISAVLRNDASFQQPFPLLHLRFSDVNLRALASRDFQPVEYLPPSLRAISNMPVNAPVQISLELLDPGTDAVNYEMRLISRYP